MEASLLNRGGDGRFPNPWNFGGVLIWLTMIALVFLIAMASSCTSKKVVQTHSSSQDSAIIYQQAVIVDSVASYYERNRTQLVERVRADTARIRLRLKELCDTAVRDALSFTFQNQTARATVANGYVELDCITPAQVNQMLELKDSVYGYMLSAMAEKNEAFHQQNSKQTHYEEVTVEVPYWPLIYWGMGVGFIVGFAACRFLPAMIDRLISRFV